MVLVARRLIKNRPISFHKLPSTSYTEIKFDFRFIFLLFFKGEFSNGMAHEEYAGVLQEGPSGEGVVQ